MKMRRRWFLITLALLAATTTAVAVIASWKPLLERIQLGEARSLLGCWDVVSQEHPEDEPIRRVHFSTQLKGLLKVQLYITFDEGAPEAIWVEGDEICVLDEVEPDLHFRLIEDRLTLEVLDVAEPPKLVLRRVRRNER